MKDPASSTNVPGHNNSKEPPASANVPSVLTSVTREDNQQREDYLQCHGVTERIPLREVRVAVSMVGGVSLAIYENGVAQELFRMVHGRGVYGVLKRITHSHAYVDILSGTSAGGMNAMFLSTALCADTNLWPTHDDWVRLGSVEALMHPPHKKDVLSLFRGNDYYYPQLQGVFETLLDQTKNVCSWATDGQGIPSGRDAATGRYGNLDLFVTGTHFRPQPLVFFDTRTQPIYNNDYAGVFSFKHRPRRGEHGESHFDPRTQEPILPADGRVSPFANGNSARRAALRDRLARVARTTSSLPAVFETSKVEAELMNGVIDLPGQVAWTYMGDGGYLNNRPLGLVLSTILKRGGNREVARKIFFVEPVATEGEAATDNLPEPRAIRHGLHALTVSSNQNLRQTLDALHLHNQKVRYIGDALDAARFKAGQTEVMSPVEQILWVRLRLQELRDAVIEQWREALLLVLSGVRVVNAQNGQAPGAANTQSIAEKERKDAAVLNEMSERLLTLLGEYCADLPPMPPAAPPPAVPARARFSLNQIDTFYLRRAALRAVQELYDGLFNSKYQLDPNDPLFRAVQVRLSECFHIEVLARLIETNVGIVLRALAQTNQTIVNGQEERIYCVPEFSAAAQALRAGSGQQAGAAEMLDLWWLCVGSLRYLVNSGKKQRKWLTPLTELAPPIDPEERKLWEKQRHERETRNAKILQRLLELKSKRICSNLSTPEGASARTNWKRAAQSNSSEPTILEQLEEYLHRLLLDSAIDLEILQAKAAVTAPMRAGQETTALSWAPFAEALLISRQATSPQDIGAAKIKERLAILDSCLFPLERASDLACWNELELVQISARDVRVGLSDREPLQKLGGDMLGNLSGFLKASWRVNDLMWGRLDGSGAIFESLLDYQRLRTVLASDGGAADNIAQVIDDYIRSGRACRQGAEEPPCDPTGEYLLQGQDGSEARDNWRLAFAQIRAWMKGPRATDPLLPDENEAFMLLRHWLLKRHQLEILCAEVPEVLTMAVAEQAEWQGTGAAKPARALEQMLELANPSTGSVDSAAAENRRIPKIGLLARLFGTHPDHTARALMMGQARSWSRSRFGEVPPAAVDPREVDTFFDKHYRVGGETTADIPAVVMVRRLLALATLNLRAVDNSLPDDFKASGPGSAVSRVLRFPAWVANLLYGTLTALSQGTTIVVALLTFCWALVLACGLILFWKWGAPGTTPKILVILLVSLGLIGLIRWCQEQASDPGEAEGAVFAGLLVLCVAIVCGGAAYLGAGSGWMEKRWAVGDPWLWWGTFLLMAALSYLERWLRTPAAPHGILSFEFAGSDKRATKVVQSWEGSARWVAGVSLLLDFVFIFFYAVLLYRLNAHVADAYATWIAGTPPLNGIFEQVRQKLTLFSQVLVYAPLVAGFLDIIENVFLALVLVTTPSPTPGAQASVREPGGARFWVRQVLASAARTCAFWKFVIIAISLLYFFGGMWLWLVLLNAFSS